ncbi:hypothetical protein CHS0354_035969, partial [Potamilus streckersoni]
MAMRMYTCGREERWGWSCAYTHVEVSMRRVVHAHIHMRTCELVATDTHILMQKLRQIGTDTPKYRHGSADRPTYTCERMDRLCGHAHIHKRTCGQMWTDTPTYKCR